MQALWFLILAGLMALCPGMAAAHAFGARYDLPLPLVFYLIAAGLAVAVSFAAVAIFLRRDTVQIHEVGVQIPHVVRWPGAILLRMSGMAIFLLLLITAFVGPQVATQNFATVFVWVLWWVGYLLFSAMVVETWPAVDPFRGSFLCLCRITGRDPHVGRDLPRLAPYLAPSGLLAIAWIELVSDWSEDPRALRFLMLIYAVVSILAGWRYGMAWFTRVDLFGRLFALLGRMAVLSVGRDGRLACRAPGEGLLGRPEPERGEAAMVCFLIGIVLFDGLSETPLWAAVLDGVSTSQALRGTLLALRDMGFDLLKLLLSLGLFTTVTVFFVAYMLLSALMRLMARGATSSTFILAAAMAGALLPIAIAYHLSHYVSYLLIAGQLILPAASDPLALGWDLFGTADRRIDVGVIGARQVWWVAMAALIVGHSLSVLLGHRRAIEVFGAARPAARSQWPMMVAMVGLTVLSLWILSQPIIE